jgi:hypothetical protein
MLVRASITPVYCMLFTTAAIQWLPTSRFERYSSTSCMSCFLNTRFQRITVACRSCFWLLLGAVHFKHTQPGRVMSMRPFFFPMCLWQISASYKMIPCAILRPELASLHVPAM